MPSPSGPLVNTIRPKEICFMKALFYCTLQRATLTKAAYFLKTYYYTFHNGLSGASVTPTHIRASAILLLTLRN
jgi:hypothetical protein